MSRESSSLSESSIDESQNGLVISGESDTSSINSGHIFVTDSEDEQFTLEKLQRTRKRLADEIKLMEEELTIIGQESNFVSECELLVQDHDDTTLTRSLRTGRKKFNRDPKDGMKYLIEKNVVNDTSEDVAMFLHTGELLDKSAIGTFLGEGKNYYIGVLRNFVVLYDFADMNLVDALRSFLSGFRLPGEAQKIDRMMELFAQRYCYCNPDVFKNPDSCYVLSFSVIMLNTSLHNPNVREKPTIDHFISMNRGINDGSDFPTEMLKNLYDCIKTDPFEIHDGADDLTQVFFNPDYEGYLIKEGMDLAAAIPLVTSRLATPTDRK
uniref:SEC7 domain-containing protein n=1 Tax=Amphimedon queenslandica TaxID=400682 RepID=A0A1X7V694_AMPQE